MSLNIQLSVTLRRVRQCRRVTKQALTGIQDRSVKGMNEIWYLLKCPEGKEKDCAMKYQNLAHRKKLKEVVCFEYQRMMRYGGSWHLERRTLLPGYLFLSGDLAVPGDYGAEPEGRDIPIIPCEPPYMKTLCQKDDLVVMSKGIIKNGNPMVTSGPLKGREELIRRIDRHKRTAEIEIPLGAGKTQVTVGLEIYEKS